MLVEMISFRTPSGAASGTKGDEGGRVRRTDRGGATGLGLNMMRWCVAAAMLCSGSNSPCVALVATLSTHHQTIVLADNHPSRSRMRTCVKHFVLVLCRKGAMQRQQQPALAVCRIAPQRLRQAHNVRHACHCVTAGAGQVQDRMLETIIREYANVYQNVYQ